MKRLPALLKAGQTSEPGPVLSFVVEPRFQVHARRSGDMEIRDAHEGDAAVIADLAAGDIDPRHLVRERVVRVATDSSDPTEERSEDGGIAGFLAFDARTDAIHVTRIGGSDDAVGGLLADAIRYANREGLPVEAVVPVDGSTAVALETKGFDRVGSGPRFEGRETARYRLDPA